MISKYRKSKNVNKNIIAKISHNEYRDVLMNKKMRKLMNIIQSENH